GVMLALGVARDFGADDALRVGLRCGAAHAPDPPADPLDFQRARAWTIMRAYAAYGVERQGGAPPDLTGGAYHKPPPGGSIVAWVRCSVRASSGSGYFER